MCFITYNGKFYMQYNCLHDRTSIKICIILSPFLTHKMNLPLKQRRHKVHKNSRTYVPDYTTSRSHNLGIHFRENIVFQMDYIFHNNCTLYFDVFFLTVQTSIELFHQPTLMHNFLYSLTIYLLHYYPRHVSSINMPIFKKKNCIHTASGIFALCKRLHITLVESVLPNC